MNREEVKTIFHELTKALYIEDEQVLNDINYNIVLLKDNIKKVYLQKHITELQNISNHLEEIFEELFRTYEDPSLKIQSEQIVLQLNQLINNF